MGKNIRITWPDQSNAILSNFILTGLHAACIHAACTHVKIEYIRTEMILMSVLDAHTAHIIRMFCNHHLTGLHAFFHHEVQNVCHLSRLCVLAVIPKSKWYVAFQIPTLCYFYFAKEEVCRRRYKVRRKDYRSRDRHGQYNYPRRPDDSVVFLDVN